MSIEDIEIENIDRAERLIVEKHGELPKSLENHLNGFRETLMSYEIDEVLLSRISDVMYEVSSLESMKEIEEKVKYLNDTF